MAIQPPADDDDDYELELEPVDPEIIAHHQARAQHAVESAVKTIDVDELYEGQSAYSDLDLDLSGLKSFRFTTRTLLLLTAIVAIGMTIRIMFGGCMMIFVGMMAAVAVGWYWVSRLEREKEVERARRREEFFANRGTVAAPVAPAAASAAPAKPASPFDDAPAGAVEGAPAAAEEGAPEKLPFFDVKFAFSTQELLITMTAVAVAFGLLTWITPSQSPKVLGAIALAGLITLGAGLQPHRLIVLGWGVLMAIYVGYSLLFATVLPTGP